LSHRICTGNARRRLGALIEELAPAWLAQQESRLRARRGHDRLRAEGAGPHHDPPSADRLFATLVILRFQLPHAALAVFYGVHRCTITRAVYEIRPLLAARGFAVPGTAGPRLRTLADVFAYAASEGVKLRVDGTEVQVRRACLSGCQVRLVKNAKYRPVGPRYCRWLLPGSLRPLMLLLGTHPHHAEVTALLRWSAGGQGHAVPACGFTPRQGACLCLHAQCFAAGSAEPSQGRYSA
jgi:Helix-turn-helix of DDE superfamily endonuclease